MLYCSLFCFKTLRRQLTDERGQGLIEYLVIVALVGVATIGIMRTVSSTVTARFGNIAQSLGASKSDLKSSGAGDRKDLTNFMNGSGGGSKGGSRGLHSDARDASDDSSSSSGGSQ